MRCLSQPQILAQHGNFVCKACTALPIFCADFDCLAGAKEPQARGHINQAAQQRDSGIHLRDEMRAVP